ncbi:hypothetical protein NCS52_00272000 [Fusarium sp. LHS14.1]|nr:hypothetical protein NCS52_00272000 [Fusarium sp. LHS14.1]
MEIDYLPSANELAANRKIIEQKGAVHDWLFDRSLDLSSPSCENSPSDILALYKRHDYSNDEVPFGNRTKNRHSPDQVYFNDKKVTLAEEDYDIIASNRNWGNAPMLYSIADTHLYQPESSQAAIEKFERLRNRTTKENEGITGSADLQGKRDFRPPPVRMSSLAKKPIPSTYTALVSMGPNLDSIAETELAAYQRLPSPPNPVVTSDNPATATSPKSQPSSETSGPQMEGVQTTSNNHSNEASNLPLPQEDRTKPTPEQARRGAGLGPRAPTPSLPASDAQRTRAQPAISNQTVDNDLARRRLDTMRSSYVPAGDTSRDMSSGASRYTFEHGDSFVDRGKEIFEGNRPRHPEHTCSDRYLSAEINELYSGWVETNEGDSNMVSDNEHVWDLSEDWLIEHDFSAELARPASIESLLFPGITSSPQKSIDSEPGKSAENNERSVDRDSKGSDNGPPTPPHSRSPCPDADPVEDKPKGSTPTEDSAFECRATSEAQHHCEILMPGSIRNKRQVGLARVKIDIVSLPNMNSPLTGQSDDESGQSSDYQTETGEGFDEEQADTEDQDGANPSPPDLPSGSSGGSSSLTGTNTNSSGKNASRGAGSSGHARLRTKASRSTSKKSAERFACPYQAFEASQPCFRPGPRNPNGGCAGIQRLKQHLSRRHMISYRCIRCWRSFETRDKSDAHSKQAGSCEAREMLTTERFMGPSQETDLEKASGSGCEEETWWEIFQLLIPGMQNRTRESLRSQYWPYYMHLDSFMMPSIIFPNALFESEHTEAHVSGVPLEETGYVAQSTQSLTMDSLSFLDPAPASHTVYVPLLDALAGPPSQTGLQALQCSPASQSAVSTSTPNTNPQTVTRATSTLQLPETVTQLSQGASDQTKLQRNHERLKARHSRLEEEVDEFLAANRTARSDLGRADAAINDLLALEDLPRNIEDTLSEVSQILELVRKRLR